MKLQKIAWNLIIPITFTPFKMMNINKRTGKQRPDAPNPCKVTLKIADTIIVTLF